MFRDSKKKYKDLAVYFCQNSNVEKRLLILFEMIYKTPSILEPVRGVNNKAEGLMKKWGYRLYPTVKRTTLVFDEETSLFTKILHPQKLKDRLLFSVLLKYRLLIAGFQDILNAGVKVPEIKGYGYFKKGGLPFYIFVSLEGRSLYDMVIRNSEVLSEETIAEVIDGIVGLHKKGFYMGDAHLSHIFVMDGRFEGFIDIDGIKRVGFFKNRCYAKDLGYLNHPELPFTKDEKQRIVDSYCEKMGIGNKEQFKMLIKEYTEKRWKA